MDDQLVWICSICNKPVADYRGHIFVDMAEVLKRRGKAETSIELVSDLKRQFEAGILGADLAHWQVMHDDCDPDLGRESYAMPIADVRSCWDVLASTSHLMGKDWLSVTDWFSVLGRIAREHGSNQ